MDEDIDVSEKEEKKKKSVPSQFFPKNYKVLLNPFSKIDPELIKKLTEIRLPSAPDIEYPKLPELKQEPTNKQILEILKERQQAEQEYSRKKTEYNQKMLEYNEQIKSNNEDLLKITQESTKSQGKMLFITILMLVVTIVMVVITLYSVFFSPT